MMFVMYAAKRTVVGYSDVIQSLGILFKGKQSAHSTGWPNKSQLRGLAFIMSMPLLLPFHGDPLAPSKFPEKSSD